MEETLNTHIRPSWDEYFIGIMHQVATRATCDRGRSGCVIVKGRNILATGYVGSPVGTKHCDEIGHEFNSVTHEDGTVTQHCIRTIHAEQNAICRAAKLGVALDGATMYSRMTPCYVCAKMIINVGRVRVVCEKDYHASEESKRVFKEANVELVILDETIEKYEKM